MIFHKNGNGNRELKSLTGSYYETNDFDKINGDLRTAQDEIADIIGKDLMDDVKQKYIDDSDQTLVELVQKPIAIIATLRMYQKNDLAHESTGRKFKVADGEKIPWEWQLERDNEIQLNEYYRAVDNLIRYLNSTDNALWKKSDHYKKSQKVIIRSGAEFDSFFPIDKSERMYYMLVGFIYEAQQLTVKRAFGPKWDDLLTNKDSDEYYAAAKATALLAMSIAFRRMPLSLIPGGVVKRYIKEAGMTAGNAASLQDVSRVCDWLDQDAATWIDEMKRARDGGDAEYQLLPNNDKHNKYCTL